MRFIRPFLKLRKTPLQWLVALSAVLLCLASFLADDAVATGFASLHCPFLNSLVFALNRLGDWPCHTALGLAAAGVLWNTGRRDLTRVIAAMILASTLTGLTVNAIRATTGRPRPCAKVQDGFYGMKKDGKWIVGKCQYQAFPSAHTATAMAFAGVALFTGFRYGWAVALFGPLVGCARIYSGAHHFSDVVVAVAIGLLFSRWSWRFVESRWTVTRRRGVLHLPSPARASGALPSVPA
jgi:membrane-associated phospholipid phosphatase